MKSLLFIATALFMGCGSDGVSDSKKLSDLTVAESKETCLDIADEYPARTVTCDGQSFTFGGDKAQCETITAEDQAPATCTATVGDARDCFDALYSQTDAQLCDPATPEPAACAKLEGC